MIDPTHRDGVLWLTLNRPANANALDEATHAALVAAIRQAGARHDVRALVLAAAGARAFCAGADLKEFSELPPGDAQQRRRTLLLQTLDTLLALHKPVIAAVQAPAAGAGAMLALACDEVFITEDAWLGFPEAAHGMPSPMGAVMLERRTSWPTVQAMLQAGERYSAQQAIRAGLADQVASAGSLVEACRARAAHLASISPAAFAANKAWLLAPWRRRLAEAAAYASRQQN